MDQNQTVDNDLQKAIDDITNNTNIDPVFSDPIAAPSTVPEDDTGELGDPIGPFADPSEESPVAPPEPPTPPAPVEPPSDITTPLHSPSDTPPTSTTLPTTPPLPDIKPPVQPEPMAPPMPEEQPATVPSSSIYPDFSAPPAPPIPPAPLAESSSSMLNMRQIKEAALRDLVPLLNHLNMSPSQKFGLYRNIFEDLHDYAVLEQAYHAASDIPDETERAEALLYLVEAIDKM